MIFLRQNTATRVTVGPFFDKTDGITPEVALTATNEKLTFIVDDGGVPTLVIDTTATASGGDNDFIHITNDDAGYYDLELTAAQTNYVGRAKLAITYATDHCPVFHEFSILPVNVYDSMFGMDNLQVDVTQLLGTAWLTPGTAGTPDVNLKLLSGDATAADNAESFFDGTGYAGTNNVIPIVTTAGLADDAITSAKFDEVTAFPLKLSDVGSTQIARTGNDSDTLETLSDQIDTVCVFDASIDSVVLAAVQSLYAPAKVDDIPSSDITAIKAVTDDMSEMLEDDGGVKRFTANALELIDLSSVTFSMSGMGSIACTYSLTKSENGLPISNVVISVTTDSTGQNVVASGVTDQNGNITLYLDAGTVYIWRYKSGINFTNPVSVTYSLSSMSASGTGTTATQQSNSRSRVTYAGSS